ncbi:hypothetical protein JG687_00010677 [Phytophthora cactorum]|uniref:RxLR effector protein n=1 Tax=Phytophthora cactorum TaxID=29920 RepID=A0A329S7E9_9STRA|nr:hypothetical protein Pcac1_g7014 [Phytophthora cactorum]KAG2796405.1 hypothetical protein PC112_g22220 [Phytophthora cactorum]KAG2838403.1 hypothetical protein PC111_g4248 [Phytophthora cactorum]KAG2847469.1 hypothetical protein PC113_g17769 [Phytophthora cactorum]KAG2885979.1 hypothetical protein PC114_g19477 [Phytophthora cactorum]
MRLQKACILLLAAVAFTITDSTFALTDQTRENGTPRGSAVGDQRLRQHDIGEGGLGDEERMFKTKEIAKGLKLDGNKLDDVIPKKEIEMVNLQKFDDALDKNKIDDLLALQHLTGKIGNNDAESVARSAANIFREWKTNKVGLNQAEKIMRRAGIADDEAITYALTWYTYFYRVVK